MEIKKTLLKKEDIFIDIFGQDKVKKQLKSALLTDRHVILVGPPGVGKTTLARDLANVLKVKDFVRIQGSPDLTAEDLLGDIDPVKALKFGPLSIEAFTKGKIFKADKGILFFDELNRCPEKLQNALLQVLAEKKATIGSYDVDFDLDFVFIGSLHYNEEILIMKDRIIEKVKIGKFIDNQIKKSGAKTINGSEVTKNPEKISAFSYNPKNNRIEPLPITAFIRHKPTDYIYEISLSKGRKVKVTGKHSVFSEHKKNLIPIEVKNLKVGDKIAIPSKIAYKPLDIKDIDLIPFFNELKINKHFFLKGDEICKFIEKNKKILNEKYSSHQIANCKYFKRLPILGIDTKSLNGLKKVKICVNGSKNSIKRVLKVDNDLCWLIGFFVAEGFTQKAINNKGTYRYNIWLSNKKLNILKRARKIISDKFGIKTIIKQDKRTGVYDLTVSSLPLFYVFERLLELPKGCSNKIVPKLIFQLSKKKIKFFLAGYIDGDGTYYTDKNNYSVIKMSTVSRKLANDLAYLFLIFGKIASIKKIKERRKNHKDCYHIYICDANVRDILKMKEGNKYISYEKVLDIKKLYTKPTKVYDLEVLNNRKTDNFIGGFGGILLHNTMNPEDSSTEKLSDVLLDRFDLVYVSYPESLEIEKRIVLEKGKKLDVEFPSQLIDTAIGYVRELREDEKIERKPSVRASLGLYERAQANALLNGKKVVDFSDVEEAVVSVISHRISLKPSVKYLQDPRDYVREQFSKFKEETDADRGDLL